jgi:hypothetical protein
MSDLSVLSLDQEFENKGFSLYQFRKLFELCLKTDIFNSFQALNESLMEVIDPLSLNGCIFEQNTLQKLQSLSWNSDQIVNYSLSKLIKLGTIYPFEKRFCFGICMLIYCLIKIETKYENFQLVGELQSLNDSLFLTAEQNEYLQRDLRY